MKSLLLAATFSCSLLQAVEELPPPYNSLEEILPFNPAGWYANAMSLEDLIRRNNVCVVIELGSWLGTSTRHIASVLPQNGVVYAVDHWLGSAENQSDPLLPTLYEQFLSNVVHAHLTHKIIPMRMTTEAASGEFFKEGIVPDLVYVDASHDEQSVYDDLTAYFPLVQGHGILCGDDWGWGGVEQGLPVQKAVTRFANENRLKIHSNGWFWYFSE